MSKRLILDANILIRGVLGTRVSDLIETHGDRVGFITTDEAVEDAIAYIPTIMGKHDYDEVEITAALEKLDTLLRFVSILPMENLHTYEEAARQRLKNRDEEDWPFVALSLLLKCPIWTEDTDFFGTGVPTWTSDRIELFFADVNEAGDNH